MVSSLKYQLIYSKEALKDADKIKQDPRLVQKIKILLNALEEDPFALPYKALQGKLKGAYSRRINLKHRLVYQIIEEGKYVKILRMWTHYED